jgi:hypothetical protein
MKNNLVYQILLLNMQAIENGELETYYIKKYGYVQKAKDFMKKCNADIDKLEAIEKDLKKEYDSLEVNSENIPRLEYCSKMLLMFKEFDETLLYKIEEKINHLIPLKARALEEADFKTAGNINEEIRQLQKYYNTNKRYLKK